jgi:uncharacterized Zn-finger protein
LYQSALVSPPQVFDQSPIQSSEALSDFSFDNDILSEFSLFRIPLYDTLSDTTQFDSLHGLSVAFPFISMEKEDMTQALKKKKYDKKFIYDVCKCQFARKHDLQRHSHIHTGVKPYSCLNCSKAFRRTDALKHHLRVVESCRNSSIIQAMKTTGNRRYRNL